ncbi:MAG: trigger factor [Oscillospiraceae bacterium]|jgi:trigger factor
MLVAKNPVETNKYELEIKVDAADFESALQKAYLQNKNKIQVPGFRKGKAPRKLIEKLYGAEVFYEDAINNSYPDVLQAAVKEAELELVDRPEVEVTAVSKEDGYTFKATCIVKPDVEVSDYKGIKVTKTVNPVDDAAINEELARMQDRGARTITVEDRAAEKGDTAVFDFEGFVDDKPFDGGKAEDFSLELGSGQFIPGFEDQMIGHKAGEEFDVNVPFPDNYHVEELKGKPAVFKIKLHELKAKELPELDDEFAKDVSEFDTLDDLKADIKKKMEEKNAKDADEQVENDLVDAVVADMKGEIPEVMFENRTQEAVNEFAYRLQSQGMSLDLYLQYTGMDADALKGTFRAQSEKQVKVRLALEKIVELENIVPSEEDIDEQYKKMAESYGMEADKLKEIVPADDLVKDIAVNKAIDLIKETAVISEKKPAAKKSTAKKSTAKKADADKAADDGEKAPAKKTAAKKSTAKKAEKAEDAE